MKKIYLFLLFNYIYSNNLLASESISSVSSSSTSRMASSGSSSSSSSSSEQLTKNENFLNAVMDDLDINIIEKLIEFGAKVNYNRQGINIRARDFDITKESNRCNTALTYAIINQNEALICKLLTLGASAFYIDIDGNDPYQLAEIKGFKENTLRHLEISKSLAKNKNSTVLDFVSRLNENKTCIKMEKPLEYPDQEPTDIFIHTTNPSRIRVFNNTYEINSNKPKYEAEFIITES